MLKGLISVACGYSEGLSDLFSS